MSGISPRSPSAVRGFTSHNKNGYPHQYNGSEELERPPKRSRAYSEELERPSKRRRDSSEELESPSKRRRDGSQELERPPKRRRDDFSVDRYAPYSRQTNYNWVSGNEYAKNQKISANNILSFIKRTSNQSLILA